MSILSAIRLSKSPAAAFVVVGLGWGCFAAFVPVLKDAIGASDALFGLLMLGSAVGLASSMWLAPLLDPVLKARGMQIGGVFFMLAYLLPGLSTTPAMFVMAMTLVGVASGLTDVFMNTRVSELEARSGRSLMNANHGMFSVGYVIGAIFAGIGREVGLGPTPVFGALLIITLALTSVMKMDIQTQDRSSIAKGNYPWALILLCGAVVLIAFMTEATVESWSAIHVERTLGGRAAEGALGPATLGITMAIGRFSGQVITEKFDELTVVIWGGLLCFVGVIIAALAPTPLVAYFGFGTMGLGVSVIGPIGLAIVGQRVRPDMRTEAISKAAVMGFSGFLIAPMLMGLVSQAYGLRVAYLSVTLLLVALIPLVWALRKSA